jgi:hypothetical protein
VLHTPLSSLLKSLRFLCRPKPVVPESFKALLKVFVAEEQSLEGQRGLKGWERSTNGFYTHRAQADRAL